MNYLDTYYVLQPRTGQTRESHPNRIAAEAEASRLVKLNPKEIFLVLHVVSQLTVDAPVTIQRIEEDRKI